MHLPSPKPRGLAATACALLCLPALFLRQNLPAETGPGWEKFFLHGYATINYYSFDWESDPQRRAQVDLERLALEPAYQVNDWLSFHAEIEFEHGGTGSTMEFDKFEEFGEFESEIEKGGEVQIEELRVSAAFFPYLNLHLGHIILPLGFASALDEPTDYFTVQRSESESHILPVIWHETGAALSGSAGPMDYRIMLVNGLDATGFSSATWIVRGHQGRFETVNAENLAWAGRLDWNPFPGTFVGAAGYYGNSAGNRPKADLRVPAHVGIADAHGQFQAGPFLARGLFLYGTLENAGAVSTANRNLSNNLNVKRTPVARAVRGGFVEAGVDALALIRMGLGMGPATAPGRGDGRGGGGVDVYGRYDAYNTMLEMDPGFFENPRWERETWSGGVNYRPHPRWILKTQFARRTLGLPTANREDTYSLGMGLVY